jgi:hypothetical protein
MKHILKLKRSAQTTSIEDLLFCELPPIISRFSSGSKHRSGNKSPPVPHKLHHKQAIAVCKTSSVLTPQKQQRVHEEQSLQGTGTRCLKKSTGLPKGKEAIESGKSKPPVPPSSPSPQPQEGHEHISSLSKISRKNSSPQPDAKYKSTERATMSIQEPCQLVAGGSNSICKTSTPQQARESHRSPVPHTHLPGHPSRSCQITHKQLPGHLSNSCQVTHKQLPGHPSRTGVGCKAMMLGRSQAADRCEAMQSSGSQAEVWHKAVKAEASSGGAAGVKLFDLHSMAKTRCAQLPTYFPSM